MRVKLVLFLWSVWTLSLVFPALAGAAEDVPSPDPHLLLTSIQFYAVLIGSIVPLVTYVLNHHATFIHSEPVKGFVLVGASALAGALYQLLTAGDLALDTETLQVVLFAVAGALAAHAGFWKPTNIAGRLGGGTNSDGSPSV